LKLSNKKMNKGFTLIEILMAVVVIAIGLIGVYAIVPAIFQYQAVNLDELTASFLAHEGVELVRNLRDNNWLTSSEWLNGLLGCSNGCEIDYNDNALSAYQGRFLKIDDNNFYNYETGTASRFKRKITLVKQNDNLLQVTVEVLWDGNGSPLKVQENLYNWY